MPILKPIKEIPLASSISDDDYIIIQKPGLDGSNPDPENDNTNILTLGSLRTNLLGSNRTFISTTSPEGQDLNDVWLNPITKVLRYWDSVSWVSVLQDPSVTSIQGLEDVDFTNQVPIPNGYVLSWNSTLQKWRVTNTIEKINNLTTTYLLNRKNHTDFTPISALDPSSSATESIIAFDGSRWAVRPKYTISDLNATAASNGHIPLLSSGKWQPSFLPISSIDKTDADEGECIAYNGTDWIKTFIPRVSVKSSNFNATGGFLYLVDTTNGTVTAQLPSNPPESTVIYFCDHGSSNQVISGFSKHPLVLLPATGHNIQGFTQLKLNARNDLVSIAYANNRWSIYNAASSLNQVYTTLLGGVVEGHNILFNSSLLPSRPSLNILSPLFVGVGDTNIGITVRASEIDHDQLLNFVASEHINHNSVSITAGEGLSGGGSINASRSLSLNINGLTTSSSPQLSDSIVLHTSSGLRKANLSEIPTKGLQVSLVNSSTLSAQTGYLYLLNQTTVVNLPVGVNGKTVALADYNSFTDNPVTINPNSSDLVVGKGSHTLTAKGQSIHLTYYDGNWVSSSGGVGGDNLSVSLISDSLLNAKSGLLYLLDGTEVVNLPNGQDGDRVTLVDYGALFNTTPVTIYPFTGQTIYSTTSLVLNTQHATVQLVCYQNKWVFYGTESFTEGSSGGSDGSGGGGTVTFTTNIESLTANKTLTEEDAFVQKLDPNGEHRVVTLNTMSSGRLINNSDGTYRIEVRETIAGATVITLSYQTKSRGIFFVKNDDNTFSIFEESTYYQIPEYTVNIETLRADKSLAKDSAYKQILDPDGNNRAIALNGKTSGKIINSSDGSYSINIVEQLGQLPLLELSKNTPHKVRGVEYTMQSDGNYYFEEIQTYLDFINYDVEQETLTDTKTLISTSPYFQLLNPGTSNKTVVLGSCKHGELTNDSDGTFAINIRETTTGLILYTLSNTSGYKMIEFHQKPDASYYVKLGGTY